MASSKDGSWIMINVDGQYSCRLEFGEKVKSLSDVLKYLIFLARSEYSKRVIKWWSETYSYISRMDPRFKGARGLYYFSSKECMG